MVVDTTSSNSGALEKPLAPPKEIYSSLIPSRRIQGENSFA